jgi:hypothetical protein
MVAAAVCQIDCNLHLRGPQLSEKKCVLICQCISINNQPSGYMAKTTEGCLYIVINDLYLFSGNSQVGMNITGLSMSRSIVLLRYDGAINKHACHANQFRLVVLLFGMLVLQFTDHATLA